MSALLLAALLSVPAAAAGPALTPAAAANLDEGLERLYSLDYERSRASFRRIVELEPDNPFGYLFEAGGIWWQSFQEHGLFLSTPTLQGLFEQDIEAALRKAKPYMESDDRALQADGYFVSGMALGTRGQWNLLKRRWLDAYFDGKKAIKHLKRCLKLDAEYYEAYLGLGVFDYQAAHLGGIAKLGVLFGMKGDETRGLERMGLAAERSRYARRQAAQFLASIHLSDRSDYPAALRAVRLLRAHHPDSPYFLFLELAARHLLGEKEASAALGRELLSQVAADPPSFRPKWLTLACGLSGSSCLSRQDAQSVLEWLDASLASPDAPQDGRAALLRLFRAHALELLERREEARREYERVLALPELDQSRGRARRCLESPCGRAQLLETLRRLSRGDGDWLAPGNGNVTNKG